MTLLNAPAYDERKEHLKKNILIGLTVAAGLLFVLTFAGYLLGHGWLFSNLPVEHKVDQFYTALEAKDYKKAYAIYNNDPAWEQHLDKYKDYPLERFTEDWSTDSPVGSPILSHHVDISRTAGEGNFGTAIIVAATVRSAAKPLLPQKIDIYYIKKTGQLTYPAPLILQY
jgi:hypothetical protein